MKLFQRRTVLAAPAIQFQLCIRVALYWVGCLLTVALTLGAWIALDHPDESVSQWGAALWQGYGPVFVISLLALQIALLDCLIVSNKYAGPLVRLHRAMTRLAQDERVEELHVRKGDHLQELASDFNRVAGRLQSRVPVAEQRNGTVEICSSGPTSHS